MCTKCTGIYTLNCNIKTCFYLLLEIDISHVSDFWWFYCPLRFSLNSDCLSVPGKLIDGQVSDVDEVLLVRWKLVIGDLKVCVESFFIVFLHRSRIWRPLLELVRNRISSIWLLFPEESFGYDWMNLSIS